MNAPRIGNEVGGLVRIVWISLLAFCFVAPTVSAFIAPMSSSVLIPSQVVSSKSCLQPSKKKYVHTADQVETTILVPAQVAVSSRVRQKQHKPKKAASALETTQKAKASLKIPSSHKNIAPKNGSKNGLRTIAKNKSLPKSSDRKSDGKVIRQSKFGNLPDIFWGSIPMDHLRMHPKFEPLPLPEELPRLTNLEDVRYIRQDSWQWDALHDGRCTTSQAVAALGFLEPEAGRILDVPSSWQRRSIGAYHRLQQPALRTLDEMNEALLPNNTRKGQNKTTEAKKKLSKEIWKVSTQKSAKFAATYLPPLSNTQKNKRKHNSMLHRGNGLGIRMMWGNAQEATSVLTALNYFTQQNPDVVLKEVGMCGAGLALNQTDGTSPSSLLIGATPDAILEYPDGSIEALEVKNHCPFVQSHNSQQRGHKEFMIRELPFKVPYIFPLYIPQLQLEMFCLGPECKSAIMVRQTATTGALILRIHRDDEWIDEMLYWLQRFQQDFVDKCEEPESNFFFNSPVDGPRYRAFLERTKEIANSVDLVARIPDKSIQRAHLDLPMFLD